MNYKEDGFRPFYHNFCVIPITDTTREALDGLQGADKANGILTYGFYDENTGLVLEVLAAAFSEGDNAVFGAPSTNMHPVIRIDAVAEDECLYFPDESGELAKSYADKVDLLHVYDADEDIEESRKMVFLDACRDEKDIDTVRVFLVKNSLRAEERHVRIKGLLDHGLVGTLLEEPEQEFGCHKGDEIPFLVQQTEDKKIFCVADLNLDPEERAAGLENGSLLEAAVTRFNQEHSQENFIELLELLRDSSLWVSCTAVGDEKEQLIPEILQDGEKLLLPIYSSVEAMEKCGDDVSGVRCDVYDAMALARNNQEEISGLVLNAFTEPFVLEREIWEIVEHMKVKAQLQEEDK